MICGRSGTNCSRGERRGITRNMKLSRTILSIVMSLVAQFVAAEGPKVVLTSLRGHLYVAEDYFYSKENSVVYVGGHRSRSSARHGLRRPPSDWRRSPQGHPQADHGGHGHELSSGSRGRKRLFKRIGARIVSTEMTRDLLERLGRDGPGRRKGFPGFLRFLVAPDRRLPATSNYKVEA